MFCPQQEDIPQFDWQLPQEVHLVAISEFADPCNSSLQISLIKGMKARSAFVNWTYENIERHTADTIGSWTNPKQWVIVHTSDLMMIIR